jgi:hypothetical protein
MPHLRPFIICGYMLVHGRLQCTYRKNGVHGGTLKAGSISGICKGSHQCLFCI